MTVPRDEPKIIDAEYLAKARRFAGAVMKATRGAGGTDRTRWNLAVAVDNLLDEVERLTAERDEARAELEDLRAVPPDVLQSRAEQDLRAEVARVTADAIARAQATEHARAINEVELLAKLQDAESAAAAMRPVVEAATAVVDARDADFHAQAQELTTAVNTYREPHNG